MPSSPGSAIRRSRHDRVVDTLAIARRKHPMGPNSLDALCRRYGIDNSHRTKHGALLDSELLAEVYLELIGGKQGALGLEIVQEPRPGSSESIIVAVTIGARPRPLLPRLSEAELVGARRDGRRTRRHGHLEASRLKRKARQAAGLAG